MCIQSRPLWKNFDKRRWKYFHKRKNWIHIGSPQAGPRVAAIISIVESCSRLYIPIRDYLGSVLPDWLTAQLAKSHSSRLPPGLTERIGDATHVGGGVVSKTLTIHRSEIRHADAPARIA